MTILFFTAQESQKADPNRFPINPTAKTSKTMFSLSKMRLCGKISFFKTSFLPGNRPQEFFFYSCHFFLDKKVTNSDSSGQDGLPHNQALKTIVLSPYQPTRPEPACLPSSHPAFKEVYIINS
jgi:hypothetical protein